MAKIEVKCPYCGQEKVVKYGKSRSGKQKFKCCNDECSRKIFQLEYEKNAYYPGVKEQVVEMAMNGAGVRDTGRVLKIAKDTVSGVLKKQKISRNKLWWAVDHKTNTPLAYIFGTREYKYLDELLKLLSEFNIGTVYADNNFAYSSRISPDKLVAGKRNTQQIERDHLTLRTRIKRLARKTICFSKSPEIHKAVIGTFINIHFFGRTFDKSLLL